MNKGFYRTVGNRMIGAGITDGSAGIGTSNIRRNPTVHQFTVGRGRTTVGSETVPYLGKRGGKHTAQVHGVHIGRNVALGVGAAGAAYGGYRIAKHFHDSHQQHQDPRNGIRPRNI